MCYVNAWISNVYEVHMSPTPNGSLALQRVKLSDVLEIDDETIFEVWG